MSWQERLLALSELKKFRFLFIFGSGKLTQNPKFCLITLSVGNRKRPGGGKVLSSFILVLIILLLILLINVFSTSFKVLSLFCP